MWLLIVLSVFCHVTQSQSQNISYEVRTFDDLPTVKPAARSFIPTPLVIRQNLAGKVVFVESPLFWIEARIRVPDGRNTSEVQTTFKLADDNETVVFQVYSLDPPKKLVNESKETLTLIIGASCGGFFLLCLLCTLLLYCCWWKPKHRGEDKDNADGSSHRNSSRKVTLPNTFSQKRRFYDMSGSSSVTSVSFIIVVALTCAVHAQLTSPSVEIVVHTPPGLLASEPKVFVNQEFKNTMEVNVTNMKINVYDVPSAAQVTDDLCKTNTTCSMGLCDPLTGKCSCPRGRKLRHAGSNDCIYECDKGCATGTYEASPCNETHAGVCTTCRPLCSFDEFESTACAGSTDRNCTEISQLPQIKASPNTVYEDLSQVTADILVNKEVKNLSGHYDIWLNRSSGIAVRVRLLSMDFSTTLRHVDHQNNDNDKFKTLSGSQKILNEFCKYPLPDFYTARIKKFQEIDVRKDDFRVDCPSYSGAPGARKPASGADLFCRGVDNTIVGLFGSRPASDQFKKAEFNRDCHNKMLKCGGCREKCANHVRAIPGCNMTSKQDHTLGKHKYGEHFAYCFDCCFVENCTCSSCDCGIYEKECIDKRVTCVRVKEYKIALEPVFPLSGNFKCHVEPFLGPQFDISATLWKDGRPVYGTSGGEHNLTKERDGKSEHDFGYMLIRHPTVIQTKHKKDLLVISGNINKKDFDLGWFTHQPDLTNIISSGGTKSFVHAQPRQPFGINTKSWPQRTCDGKHGKDIVLVSNKSTHQNFKAFQEMTAELDWHNHSRVYKVLDKKSSRKLSFSIASRRSVLRNMFPKTTIVNDPSLEGKLLRNRTFWTLRMSGRLEDCLGAFNVKVFDQDRPKVEVYNYDTAIIDSMDCSFTVEFHLPSGGDTNLIDKQFLVKLTDSQRSIQIMLVSPRYAPNFKLPEIKNELDIDRIVKLLLPFGYALLVMVVLLVSILVYGFKTRPKDDTQRDRDSKLHFRHILFVVWFVGVRLVKSFLLTLTLLLVIFSAIHHSNVKVIERYPEFQKQRDAIEKELTSKMDAHKVQEINRQLAYLQKGKEICDEKLRQADELIDAYFQEMRRRLIEEIKEKSIIYAAYKRIHKRFNEARAKFRHAREEFNRALKTITDEINEKVQQIRNKIKNNFWLKAAKVLYKIIDALASIFGSGLGPFMDWVNLDVRFPRIEFSLGSFSEFFDEFLKAFKLPDINFDLNLKFNFSRFKLPYKSFSLKLSELKLPEFNISSPLSGDRAKELLAVDWVVALFKSGVIVVILLVLDILWFVYRHSKTYQTAVMLLHGVPVIYELDDIKKKDEKRKKKEEEKKMRESKENLTESSESVDAESIENIGRTDSESSSKENEKSGTKKEDGKDDLSETSGETSNGKKAAQRGMQGLGYLNDAAFFVFRQLKELNYQLTKTNLVPMCLLGVMGLLLIYVIIITAKHALTVDTLDTVGYFEVKMAPLLTTRKIVNTRITSNAFIVNEIQLPYFENRVNARIAFARKKAEFFKSFQCTTAENHNKEYCFWIDGECDKVKSFTDQFLQNLTQLECHIPAVIPRRFTKFDHILYKQQLMKGINPYVVASRGLILNTFYTILVVMGVFIILLLLGEVLFFLLKRLDLIRTIKTYQIGTKIERPDAENSGPIPGKPVGRLRIPDKFRETCGDDGGDNRDGWHLEWLPEVAKTLNDSPKKTKKGKTEGRRPSKEEVELEELGDQKL